MAKMAEEIEGETYWSYKIMCNVDSCCSEWPISQMKLKLKACDLIKQYVMWSCVNVNGQVDRRN